MTLATRDEVVRLTQWAKCAGCAAKMGPGDLSAVLAPLELRRDPRLLVGRETFDDAGVFKMSDELALVQTLDFFAPIVDDPYDFGRVAATNALSDVFAMGGEPLTAMNIVGFPVGQLSLEVLTDVLRGGLDAVHEAGAHLVGGHTITDEELKYGLSVTGTIHPARILSNAGAQPGDVLILTKGIGTGILSTAAKRDALSADEIAGLVRSMTTLNAIASRAAVALGLKCATDVTGFGLLGHASHVARAPRDVARESRGAREQRHAADRDGQGADAGGCRRGDRGRDAHGRRGAQSQLSGVARGLRSRLGRRTCRARRSADERRVVRGGAAIEGGRLSRPGSRRRRHR